MLTIQDFKFMLLWPILYFGNRRTNLSGTGIEGEGCPFQWRGRVFVWER